MYEGMTKQYRFILYNHIVKENESRDELKVCCIVLQADSNDFQRFPESDGSSVRHDCDAKY